MPLCRGFTPWRLGVLSDERQHREDIRSFDIGEVANDLPDRHPAGQQLQDVLHGHAHPADV
jgi:hypothetical protein